MLLTPIVFPLPEPRSLFENELSLSMYLSLELPDRFLLMELSSPELICFLLNELKLYGFSWD